jgi:hypothetical protein
LLIVGEWMGEAQELRWWRPFVAGLLMGWVLLLRSTMLFGVVLLPLVVFAVEIDRRAARRAWGGAGINPTATGAAAPTASTAAPAAAPAAPARHRFALFTRLVGWYVAGGVTVGLASLAYFLATGSFGDLWYSQFVWVRMYAQTLFVWDSLTMSSILDLLRREWWHYFADWALFRWSLPLGVVALAALAAGRRTARRRTTPAGEGAASPASPTSPAWALAVWFAAMLLLMSSSLVQLKFFNYHWWTVMPFWMMSAALACVVAAAPCVWLWRRGEGVRASAASSLGAATRGLRWRWRAASIALAAALLLGLFDPGALFPFKGPGAFIRGVHATIHDTSTGLREYKEHVSRSVDVLTGDESVENYVARFAFEHIYRPQEEIEFARRILAATPESERPPRLFVWGFRPSLYFLTGSGGPSRFAYNLPLRASWSPPEWLEHVETEVMADPPDWIAIGRNDDFWWVVGNHTLSTTWQPDWLRRELEENFEKVEELKFLELWRRRGAR